MMCLFVCVLYNDGDGLVKETAATEEFTHDAGGRDVGGLNGFDDVNEVEQPLGFGMFRAVLRNFFQLWCSVEFQYAQLIKQGGIKHHVGLFLEREDVDFLTTAHFMPAMQSVVGIPSAEVVVAYYAAKHTVLAAADAVDVVDGYLGEGGNVYFELQFVVNLSGEFGVECVYSFNHKDAVGTELDALAIVEGVAFEEVEGGNLYALTVEHALQVLVEQRDVEGID